MNPERLTQQIRFINEIEKLKIVYRRNNVVDGTRCENSAEHSWHVALNALLLAEHAEAESLNLCKVVKMLLIHDLVEIYAGDTWLYDSATDAEAQHAREAMSASKLFGILPDDQAAEFQNLWQEFEARETQEAAFAAAVDALQPLTNHLLTGDPSAELDSPTKSQVLNRKKHIAKSSDTLWKLAQELINRSTKRGLYQDK